jgi:hypothetical protein
MSKIAEIEAQGGVEALARAIWSGSTIWGDLEVGTVENAESPCTQCCLECWLSMHAVPSNLGNVFGPIGSLLTG